MPTDARDGLTKRARNTDPRALGRDSGASTFASQTDRARQLANEEVTLRVRLLDALRISGSFSFFDVGFDFGKPPLIILLGLLIEQLASIAVVETKCVGGPFAWRADTSFQCDEVGHAEVPVWIGEKTRQITYTLEIADLKRLVLEDHAPVISLATEHVVARGSLADTLYVSIGLRMRLLLVCRNAANAL